MVGALGRLPEPVNHLKLELHMIKRLISKELQELKTNETIVLTAGTMTTLGAITSIGKEKIEVLLKNKIVAENGQKVAISKKDSGRWRLVAFGIAS